MQTPSQLSPYERFITAQRRRLVNAMIVTIVLAMLLWFGLLPVFVGLADAPAPLWSWVLYFVAPVAGFLLPLAMQRLSAQHPRVYIGVFVAAGLASVFSANFLLERSIPSSGIAAFVALIAGNSAVLLRWVDVAVQQRASAALMVNNQVFADATSGLTLARELLTGLAPNSAVVLDRGDARMEIVGDAQRGMVCFRTPHYRTAGEWQVLIDPAGPWAPVDIPMAGTIARVERRMVPPPGTIDWAVGQFLCDPDPWVPNQYWLTGPQVAMLRPAAALDRQPAAAANKSPMQWPRRARIGQPPTARS